MAYVELKNVTSEYPNHVTAVKNVSLSFKRG